VLALPTLPLLQSDMRLLKHYESGLPVWAVWLPSYGLFYRCGGLDAVTNGIVCVKVVFTPARSAMLPS
jgi:hypothetical protein